MTLKTQKEALLLHGKVNRLFLSSMITEISKERNLLWHTTLEQSLVCYTFPEVYTFLKCKKPHTQHLDGADMGLDASSA